MEKVSGQVALGHSGDGCSINLNFLKLGMGTNTVARFCPVLLCATEHRPTCFAAVLIARLRC